MSSPLSELALCLFNVIAVRNTVLPHLRTAPSSSKVVFLEEYDDRLTADGRCIKERRVLSSMQLHFQRSAAPLHIFNTHLHDSHGDNGHTLRFQQARRIRKRLVRLSSRADSLQFLLCGDLNACSEADYTPGEQLCIYSFSGNSISPQHDYWGILSSLESLMADSFDLAARPRPKISCWACRRVDHVMFSAASVWNVIDSAVFYTAASDHLPIVCWIGLEGDVEQQC